MVVSSQMNSSEVGIQDAHTLVPESTCDDIGNGLRVFSGCQALL